MITLYVGGAFFDLPEASPYVTKAEVQLKMAGLAYRTEPSFPARGPKGQIPFVDDDGTMVGDSTFIRTHIEQKYGIDLDEGLDERQRAEAWAIERLLENHLCWAMVYFRWLVPENFEKGPAHFFDRVPEETRAKFREEAVANVASGMRAHGIGRHSQEEIVELGGRSLSALSALLGDKPYLMGDRPSGVDATALGILAGLFTPFFDSPLRRKGLSFANMVAYTDRLMRQYYPEHRWQVAA